MTFYLFHLLSSSLGTARNETFCQICSSTLHTECDRSDYVLIDFAERQNLAKFPMRRYYVIYQHVVRRHI